MSDRKILFAGGKFLGIYNFLAAFERRRILKGDPLQSDVAGVGTAGWDRACSLPGKGCVGWWGEGGGSGSRKGLLGSVKGKEGEQAEATCD